MFPDLLQQNTANSYKQTSDDILVDTTENLEPATLLFIPRVSLFYACWQKAVDISFGLLGMGLLLLLLPALALLIYLDSPGPIFYSQVRLGLQRKPFRMYKFRSMRTDAEKGKSEIWASKHDARVTRVGHLLRATHMDELPQVVNILRGDMSLIGPRPEREAFATEMEKLEPLYRSRVAIKPGLTGWAQVMYGYGSADRSELQKLQYDLYYITHRSCLLDMTILLKTVVEVVFCHGR